MNILTFMHDFPDESSCRAHFKRQREKQGITCKKCGCIKHYWLKGKEQWQCSSCSFRTCLVGSFEVCLVCDLRACLMSTFRFYPMCTFRTCLMCSFRYCLVCSLRRSDRASDAFRCEGVFVIGLL